MHRRGGPHLLERVLLLLAVLPQERHDGGSAWASRTQRWTLSVERFSPIMA